MADIRLGRLGSALLLLIPVAVIVLVVVATSGWAWEALLIPAFFIALLVWYLKAR